ncbi:glycosyltransferase [Peribacillus simplex]|uniref:glycosyltransferase family 2 protein n=1 Tax=Peribacillus simplex TaxID=1478 RepID=UPI00298D9B3E|nr:glycosyltransferase [Peribacillus simplex]MDW7616999.1 glycosyltransferase [Peribacillus simplex]
MRDVGIVMPVYKQDPNYLELALRSVLQQTYGNFYLVIVSDGAPSDTVEVIQKVTKGDERVHLILKEKNEGVAKTLNIGFDHFMQLDEVKYFTWVSSDNFYYPTYVEKLRNALNTAPDNVGLAYSSFRHIDDNGDFLKEPNFEKFYKYQDQPKESLLDFCFIGTSFMYKKEIAAMIEGYKLEPVEDYEYWLRLTDHCEIVYIPEALMHYRTNSPLSVSAQLRNSKEEHRRWRYAFNLARQEARNRRKVPFLLTIIYPVLDGKEGTIEKLEQLLEQTFSNFKLIIIDRSFDKTAINVLQHIEDPRIKFLNLPGITERESIIEGMKEADTPFALIYGKGNFPSSPSMLNNFIIQVSQLQVNDFAMVDHNDFNAGKRLIISKEAPVFGNLYKTEKLKEILSI